jgi:putative ABC transport system permease protein
MKRVLSWLLYLFPAGFRARYGHELADLLEEQAREVRRRNGWIGVLRMWVFQGTDLVRSGIAERQAERQARREARGGGVARPPGPGLPTMPQRRGEGMLAATVPELKQAFRALLRTPGFTVLAILTMALGIGATTAIFTVVNGVLIRPLPYPDSDQIVAVYHRLPPLGFDKMNHTSSTYLTYRDDNRVFAQMGAWWEAQVPVTGLDEPEQVEVIGITEQILPALEVQPAQGRGFTSVDTGPDAPLTVILSHGYWRRRFGGDPGVLGETLRVAGAAAEIIGVMPEDFRFLGKEVSLYLPIQLDATAMPTVLSFDYRVIGRLEAGVSLQEANLDIERMIPLSLDRYAWATEDQIQEWQLGANVRPLKEAVVGDAGSVLWILLGGVALVLLIACANVANLYLVRAEGRRREIAVRAALGASRSRVARQFLMESVLLGMFSGLVGLWLAYIAIPGIVSLSPDSLPRHQEIVVDPVVLLFTLAISLVSGLVFGLFPLAYHGSRDLVVALKDGGRGASDNRRRHRVRAALAIAEVAVALVLLVSAGLMMRSFQALRGVEPGFREPTQALTFRLAVPRAEVPGDDQTIAVYEQILARLGELPGVDSVGAISGLTMEGRSNQNSFLAENAPAGDGEVLRGAYKAIAGDYFDTMGIPLVAGRTIDWDDIRARRPVGMINERLARELWGDPAQALGKRIRHSGNDPWREVIGVVGNVRDGGLRSSPPALAYWPIVVEDFLGFDVWLRREMAFVVRTERGDPLSLLPEIRGAIWSVNPNLPLAEVRTLDDLVAVNMARTSFTLVMLGLAAGVAVLLGTVGIYGVVSYVFAQRTHEIGVRMALGATRRDVNGLVLRHGGMVAAAGVAVGLVGAVGLTRFLTTLLYDVQPVDPATYLVAALAVVIVSLLASYIPAHRAAKVDPMQSLRGE